VLFGADEIVCPAKKDLSSLPCRRVKILSRTKIACYFAVFDKVALANLGHKISDQTVGHILKAHGIEPAPERKRQTTWKTFLKAHWDVLGAIDFTTVEVWTKGRLVTFYLLFVMELKTRRVHFAGCTPSPHEDWMKQVARELTNFEDGFLNDKRYLLMDRDAKFCDAFREMLRGEGVEPVRLPPKSPNLNSYIERFMRTIKDEAHFPQVRH